MFFFICTGKSMGRIKVSGLWCWNVIWAPLRMVDIYFPDSRRRNDWVEMSDVYVFNEQSKISHKT